MKIYQLIDDTSGSEQLIMALDMARAFKAEGHSVKIFHNLPEETVAPFKDNGLDTRRVILGGALDILTPVQVSRGIAGDDAVVIQMFSTASLMCGVRARRLVPRGSRVAMVFHPGARPISSMQQSRESMLGELDAIVFPLQSAADDFARSHPAVDSSRLHVIQPAPSPLPSPTASSESKTAASPFTLLYLGGIIPERALDKVIGLLEALHDSAPAREVRLTVIGTGQGRDVMPQLRRVRGTSLEPLINWAGEPRNQRALIEGCDLAIFPTIRRCDDWLPMLQCMACGVPIVATAASAAPQLLTPGEQYVAIDPNDDNSMVTAVRELIDDDTRRRSIADAASRAVALAGTPADYISRLQTLYLSLLAS